MERTRTSQKRPFWNSRMRTHKMTTMPTCRERPFPPILKVVTCSVIVLSLINGSTSLRCYECSDTFKTVWKPQACQMNATAVPSRQCNSEQPYCFVRRVSVKGIVSEISRNCVNECRYGCQATSFGTTRITCISCCDTDYCNTGNTAALPVHTFTSFTEALELVMLCLSILVSSYHLS